MTTSSIALDRRRASTAGLGGAIGTAPAEISALIVHGADARH